MKINFWGVSLTSNLATHFQNSRWRTILILFVKFRVRELLKKVFLELKVTDLIE